MSNKNINKVLDKARRICSQQEQCSHDILVKLERWGARGEESNEILNRLKEEKFIDDLRYCESYVLDKFRINKWGKTKIGYNLRQKRIPPDQIQTAMDKIDMDEYIDILRSEIQKKKKGIKAKNQFDMKGKLFRYAYNKGFENELIYSIIDECTKE